MNAAAQSFGQKFCKFVDASPTPFHSVASAIARIEASGFVKLTEDVAWGKSASNGRVQRGGKYYYTKNASTIVAFAVGKQFKAGNAFKVVGAHTDSPVLKLKPKSKRSSQGYLQVNTECYGGGLWHTWFDRDLGLAGRCVVRNTATGAFEQKMVHIKEPILKVPTLCIHLQSASERDGFAPNKEEHLQPILGMLQDNLNKESSSADFPDDRHSPELLTMLSKELGCAPKDIVDLDLTLCDTQPSAMGGKDSDLIFAPRLDNQMHCFTGIEALADYCNQSGLEEDEDCSVVVLFDHEEVGSQSAQGAGSPVMRDAVARIGQCFADGPDDELLLIGLSKSLLFSADGAHAVHPNYASKHEKDHAPKLGKGTVIKTNDNQRYATNAVTGFIVRELARRHNLPIQEFCVRNDCPCGTTIGPIVSALTGIRTVDIGVPQLSMHSIRETCSSEDLYTNYKLLHAFFKDSRSIDKNLSTLN